MLRTLDTFNSYLTAARYAIASKDMAEAYYHREVDYIVMSRASCSLQSMIHSEYSSRVSSISVTIEANASE